MSSKFSKLGDDLMRVPKLEVGGTNWVVYKDRFLWSIDACGHLSMWMAPKRNQSAR